MDCANLLHSINICKDELRDCCVQRGNEGMPFIISIKDWENINWNEIFSLKRKFKNEKIQNPHKCKGCLYLCENEDFSKDNDFIATINFDHWNLCNSKCVYCSQEHNGGDKYFNVLPIITNLVQSGKFMPTGEITFQGGEPTLLPEFDELISIFVDMGIKIRIHSSGIKFSDAICKVVKNGGTLVVSSDSGNKTTYEKIKRNSHFDDVWQNLKKYSEFDTNNNSVKAKMILCPHYNDEIEEIDGFIKKVKEANVKSVIVDAEGGYSNKYNYDVPHLRFLIEYLKLLCAQNDINLDYYDSARFIVNRDPNFVLPTDKQAVLSEYKRLKDKFSGRFYDYESL